MAQLFTIHTASVFMNAVNGSEKVCTRVAMATGEGGELLLCGSLTSVLFAVVNNIKELSALLSLTRLLPDKQAVCRCEEEREGERDKARGGSERGGGERGERVTGR